MSQQGDLQVTEVGIKLAFNTRRDLSTSPTVTIEFERPDGSTGTWPGTIDDATAGIVSYTTVSEADLNLPGRWRFQPKLAFSGAGAVFGRTVELDIKPLFGL